MTNEFIKLEQQSGLSTKEFCQVLGISSVILHRYLNKDVEMSVAYFNMYKEKLEEYLKSKNK